MKRHFTIIIAMLLCAATAYAQCDSTLTLRPVTSTFAIEGGSAHIADTYLTPLHYRGLHTSFQYERDQAMRFDPQRWVMQLKLGFVFDNTENPARNATMVNACVNGGWAMMRRWRLSHGLTLGIGPGTSVEGGVLYLSRNGNNPASAKVGWSIDATGFIGWNTRIWRLPLTLRYQATTAALGAFFSPNYGELYYQIYLGNRDGLLHFAWPGDYFNLDNLLTADLHFGNTSLRLGYHGRVFSSKANDIVSQNITHAVVIGITTEWISLNPTKHKVDATLISPY